MARNQKTARIEVDGVRLRVSRGGRLLHPIPGPKAVQRLTAGGRVHRLYGDVYLRDMQLLAKAFGLEGDRATLQVIDDPERQVK